ncbi:methyl-accepting chemotaxis protein [Oscillospiraceae bacterium PP1C4]
MILNVLFGITVLAVIALAVKVIMLSNKLEEKTQWFESVLDGLPYMVSVTDLDMKWVFVNKAVEKKMGKSRAQLKGVKCSTMHTDVCETENCGIADLKKGIHSTSYRENGVGLEICLEYVYDKKGKEVGFIEAVHDVSEIYRASDKQNIIMKQLKETSQGISAIAENVSKNSIDIAHSASEQVDTMQVLFQSINTVTEQITSNATSSESANNISDEMIVEIERENTQMQKTISAMQEIEKSSQGIEKIIKSIDDIAFQTNILALNAAVEAARAGVSGKGFAVVADEVRNLAGKSGQAARNTTELIEGSAQNVKTGTQMANISAQTLAEIVKKANQFTVLIRQISNASAQQAHEISQLSSGLGQVLKSVRDTSEIAGQNAHSTQKLVSQLVLLNQIAAGNNATNLTQERGTKRELVPQKA